MGFSNAKNSKEIMKETRLIGAMRKDPAFINPHSKQDQKTRPTTQSKKAD